jgi:molecular chaperone IbpA
MFLASLREKHHIYCLFKDKIMRLDYTPFARHSVGFDKLFSMLGEAAQDTSYPPFNIERANENDYKVALAVAGFKQDDITIELENNALKVTGEKAEAEATTEFLHKGIAARGFERRFQLADHMKVSDATIEDGILTINLQREIPESQKPRRIAINANNT